MQRPAWLRWQKIQLSPWLVAAMLVTGLVPVGYLVGRDWLRLSSGSPEELERFIREITYAPSPALIVYALVAQGLLLWFTYFSGSTRVRQSDKFAVFLMLTGSAIGWVLTILRWAAR